MDRTKIVSYRQWRNTIVKKGYSNDTYRNDEAFYKFYDQARTFILAEKNDQTLPEVRLTMLNFNKKSGAGSEKKLIQELIDKCKKQSIFRKNRVDEIKQQIQNNTYNVSGKAVVDKWFPKDPEK